jgi:preprotein translocase subunit SecG
MSTLLLIVHLCISVGLISLILLQSSQGGLGSGFGGGSGYRTKRGAERVVFVMTIVLAVLFFVTSVTTFLVR